MENRISDFLGLKSFAVAGSFKNESKHAYKILKTLLDKGYEVFPVSLTGDEVLKRKLYRKIGDIPAKVDVVTLVTPPAASEKIVGECVGEGIKKIWFQSGAESEAALKLCRDNGIDFIAGLCVMMEQI